MIPSLRDEVSEPARKEGLAARFGISRFLCSKRAAVWAAVFLAAFICTYRLAIFIPQPLDGPHTLRPILNHWLIAFERSYATPEEAYEAWRFYCLVALLIPPFLATLYFAHAQGIAKLSSRIARMFYSRTLLFTAIAAALFLCRYPALVDYQLNPDEGQFLSAAYKLFYDPSFFHSVDCNTSGPLNVYPMMLPAVFGVSPDYASSRLLVLLIALAAIYLLYRTIGLLAPDAIARVAILPLAGAVAVFENPNLVHYSSEQIPILLVAITLYTATRVLRNPAAHRGPIVVLGLLTSAAFFAKLQCVPIVFSIAMVPIAYVYAAKAPGRWWRPVLWFATGAASLFLLNAAICLADGVWTNFWTSYIVANRHYADLGSNFVSELPAFVDYIMYTPESGYYLISLVALGAAFTLTDFRRRSSGEQGRFLQLASISILVIIVGMAALLGSEMAQIASYVSIVAFFGALVYFLLFFERGAFGTDPIRWFGLLSLVAMAVAVFCVYRPHRPFPHYLFLLFPPVASVMGWMLVRQANPREDSASGGRLAFPLIFIALAAAQPTYVWGAGNPHRVRTIVDTIQAPEGDLIRALTTPKGQIFVWGWTADPYLSSGHASAAREYNLFYFFDAPPDLNSYFRGRLLHDLSQNAPEVFVDAAGPMSWVYGDRFKYSFEQFPEIAQFVSDFYVHIGDAYNERFFVRRDLAARASSVKLPKKCAASAIRCAESRQMNYWEGATTPVIADLPATQMPAHALMEVDFIPAGRQSQYATILNNEAVPDSFRGFRFYHMGGDEYHLLVGVGDRWVVSNPLLLPAGKPASLAIAFDHQEIHIRNNGSTVAEMHLPSPFANAPGAITVGSWIGGQFRFTGSIQFFQIVDLDK